MGAGDRRVQRVVPDIAPFKERLLQFDFFKDFVDDVPEKKKKVDETAIVADEKDKQEGQTAASSNRTATAVGQTATPADAQKTKDSLQKVPLHFQDEQQYIDVFLPLFWEETKMQLQRCRAIEMKSAEKVSFLGSRQSGNFIKLEFERTPENSLGQYYFSNDLVLFTQLENPLEECDTQFLALVDSSVMTRFSVTARLDMKAGKGTREFQVALALSKKLPWHLAKVSSIVTQLREYEALMSLPNICMKALIVNREEMVNKSAGTEMQAAPAVGEDFIRAQTSKGGAAADIVQEDPQLFDIPAKLDHWIKSRYNTSQIEAISDSRKVSGITLVQGPPGTGKTTTILGILAVLLSAKGKISKAVSYTRSKIGGKDAKEGGMEVDTDDEDTNDEEDEAVLEKRRKERVARLRSRAPWLRGGYVPWADGLPQELCTPGDGRLRRPYAKLGPKDVVAMSEVQEDVAPQKVLVCAPSNAAIDEVLRRVSQDGIIDGDGRPKKPSIIRLGPNVHPSLEEFSFDKVVQKRLEKSAVAVDQNVKEAEKERVMRDARIVCATLSVSGSRDMVGAPFDFDTVVVDEASQGIELSMLVPLKLGCRRLILVGDPQQLPATCFSSVALAHGYERSLFQRLQETQHRVNMLSEQYRMHPAISYFPSQQFYDGRLLNVKEKEEFEKEFPAPWSSIPCFGPVVFFHLKGSQSKAMQSLVNEDEADFIIQLFSMIAEVRPGEQWRKRIAVISPYAEQVGLIRSKFRVLFGVGPKKPCPIDVNTVDGFQGREKDCIIVSTVRADIKEHTIGFVRDRRRMNVAFTRARLNLWVVGHAEVLRKNKDWGNFIKQQEEAVRLLRVSKPFDNFLGRYLSGWYARNPQLEKPDCPMIRSAEEQQANAANQQAEQKAEESDVEVNQEEDLELRDIEEVSQEADSDVDQDGEDEHMGQADAGDARADDDDDNKPMVAEEAGRQPAQDDYTAQHQDHDGD